MESGDNHGSQKIPWILAGKAGGTMLKSGTCKGGSTISNAIVRFKRNQTTGAITEPAGEAGCVSEDGSGRCADGHALLDAVWVVPSSDGKSLYVASLQSNALARLLLGRAYQNTNRTLLGIDQFRAALKLNPELPLGHYHLGFAYASLGHNPDAIAEYKKEIAHNGDNPTVLYQLGHLLLQTGDWESARLSLQKATEIDPQSAEAFYDLGKALLLAREANAAIAAFERCAQLSPTDPSPHYQLARTLDNTGKHEIAQVEWQRFHQLTKAQRQTGGMASGQSQ